MSGSDKPATRNEIERKLKELSANMDQVLSLLRQKEELKKQLGKIQHVINYRQAVERIQELLVNNLTESDRVVCKSKSTGPSTRACDKSVLQEIVEHYVIQPDHGSVGFVISTGRDDADDDGLESGFIYKPALSPLIV